MEPALFLHYGPLPSLATCIPSLVSTTRATRPHLSFSRSSLLQSDGSTGHLKWHSFNPMIEKKSSSVKASAFPMGGKAALKSLLDINVYLASSDAVSKKGTFSLPSRPTIEDIAVLKMEALWLLKSGKDDEAEERLRTEIKSCENDRDTSYNLGIALAEILICREKYKEAQEYLKEQLHPSDRRFSLYKVKLAEFQDQGVDGIRVMLENRSMKNHFRMDMEFHDPCKFHN
ncbi:hypothetical protein CJ030_MR2G005639 [Morella rubra]|uniref:Uncharacterized protein n=1 Tax=Morella rubra TaxID=262757 RepID=A0A6A1WAH4_9ROSI|nr:hypothetical protein CJ030_MR2G005639 [Morella rubra]